MRKLIVAELITLDGVIQAPGGADEDVNGGFVHGGWSLPYWHDAIGLHFTQAMNEADALLLGRRTWQIHGDGFEPMPAGDPFGDMMNGIHQYVVSTTLKSTDSWRNSTLINKNVVEEIRRLKSLPGKNILLDGSSLLAHTLIENDLVDEYALHIHPLILGSGKRLFPVNRRVNLKLINSERLPTGIGFQHYQPAR